MEIVQIPLLRDNYAYLLHDETGQTAVIDPSEAEPVLEEAKKRGWEISYIFNTHHHYDHSDGNKEIKEKTGCKVVGSVIDEDRIPGIDITVGGKKHDEFDTFKLGNTEIKIMDTPGHTRGHIVYWIESEKAVFTGDTMFALGCGRLFEGTEEEMFKSLSRIASLPEDTKVYCGHEYTYMNMYSALSILPESKELEEFAKQVMEKHSKGEPVVPTTIAQEKAFNPYLRAETLGL